MTNELSDLYVLNPGSFSEDRFVSPVRYPNLPRPSMASFTDWDHSRKFLPFKRWTVICIEFEVWSRLETTGVLVLSEVASDSDVNPYLPKVTSLLLVCFAMGEKF